MSPCPKPETLQLLLADGLSASAEQAVVAHVQECRRCQEALAGLADSLRDFLPPAGWHSDRLPTVPSGAAAHDSVNRLPQVPGYELLAEIGRGGMGVVYRARHLSLKRTVALKMVLAGSHADAADLARLRHEAEAVARLQHPNIVQVFEVGEHDGLPFLSLEYVSGSNLAVKLAGQPLPPVRAAVLVETLARAVDYAHRQGLVHRDLKPANVLVAEDGTPKVTDFGLAKRLGEASGQTQSGAVVGTPSYMAPEQAAGNGKEVGPATDVHALGALLYECLTGRPPFQGATVLETLEQVCSRDPVPVRQLQSGVPRDLETICQHCLRKDPHRRYGSALELAEDLQRFLGHEPIRARQVGTLERWARWVRRRPAVAAVYGLLAAVVVLGSLGAGILRLWLLAEEAQQRAAQARDREVAEHERAEQALYVNRIARAQREWEKARVDLALDVLDACPVNRRDWEWRYLRRLCQGTPLTLYGHLDPVIAVAFHPEGTRLASASLDRTVKVWDLRTGREVLTCQGGKGVTSVVFSPDGTRLAGAAFDYVKVWDARTGELQLSFQGTPSVVNRVTFSPDGTRIAGGIGGFRRPGLVKVWNARTGRELLSLKSHTDLVSSVMFSPEGARLASASLDGTVKVWNAQTGQEMLTLKGHSSGVYAVAFSPDGVRLASASQDRTVKVWEAHTGKELLTLKGHADEVRTVAFSPDGVRIVSAGGDQTYSHFPGEVKVWDGHSGQGLLTLKGHLSYVTAVAFSPEGRHVASASADQTVKVWDTRIDPAALSLSGHVKRIGAIAFSPDGTCIASASEDRTVKVWNARTGQEMLTLKGHTQRVSAVAFSPDGTRIASASSDQTVKMWNAHSGEELRTVKRHTRPVTAMAFSPDGSRLAIADDDLLQGAVPIGRGLVITPPRQAGPDDGTVSVWDAQSGQTLLSLRHTNLVHRVAFSPNGAWLASAGSGMVKVWNARTGREVRTFDGHGPHVGAIAFSPDGTHLAIADGVDVKVGDVQTGQMQFSLRHPGTVFGLAFSPDGARLATACNDPKVRLWDVQTGQETLTLEGHASEVNAVAFSPDGAWLASAGSDQKVKVWDARPGRYPRILKGHTHRIDAVVVSPDGDRIATASQDRTVKVWDVGTAEEILTLKGHTNSVGTVAFSPDGTHLVSGSNRFDTRGQPLPAEVKVWDAQTGEETSTLKYPGPVTAVAFSADGQQVCARGQKDRCKTWELTSGAEVIPIPIPNPGEPRVAVSSDHRFRAITAGNAVHIVDSQLTAEQREDLELLWRDDPGWHDRQATQAETVRDWFAADFHLRRLLGLKPNDPQLLARRARLQRLQSAWEKQHDPGKMPPVGMLP